MYMDREPRVRTPMYHDEAGRLYDEFGEPIHGIYPPQLLPPKPTGPVLNFADFLPPPPENPPPTDIDSPPHTPPRIQSPTRLRQRASKSPGSVNSYDGKNSAEKPYMKKFSIPPTCESGERGPTPPTRRFVGGSSEEPNSSGDMECMDRGIQSSLPSVLDACAHAQSAPVQSDDNEPPVPGGYGIDAEGLPSYDDVLRRNRHSTTSSVEGEVDDTPAGAMLGEWASVTEGTNSGCSSARSSAASSSDGSFFTEADFASAVARAAETAGYCVSGTVVSDPNAGKESQPLPSSRQPVRHHPLPPRPVSPYSTDSNMSEVVRQRSYPKAQRRRHHHDGPKSKSFSSSLRPSQGDRRPQNSRKQSNLQSSQTEDAPAYVRPNLPTSPAAYQQSSRQPGMPVDQLSSKRAATSGNTTPERDFNIRANPLAYKMDEQENSVV